MIRPVIQPGILGCDERDRRVGRVCGEGRRADLIADHARTGLFATQPQHRRHEVVPLPATAHRTVQATRPNDEMPRPTGSHRLFAAKLAVPIGIDRRWLIGFAIRPAPLTLATEDRVGAEVNQRRARLHESFGQLADSFDIYRPCRVAVRLRLLDELVRRRVPNHRRPQPSQYSSGLTTHAQFKLVASERNPAFTQSTRQLLAKLPVASNNDHSHDDSDAPRSPRELPTDANARDCG